MTISVALRGDFKASQLRGLARKTKDGPRRRRLFLDAGGHLRWGKPAPRRRRDRRRDTADHPGLGDAV